MVEAKYQAHIASPLDDHLHNPKLRIAYREGEFFAESAVTAFGEGGYVNDLRTAYSEGLTHFNTIGSNSVPKHPAAGEMYIR